MRSEAQEESLRFTSAGAPRLAFRVTGRGPAVVLLHGTSANHAVWGPVADGLADVATVVTVDQRGHGRSDRPGAGYAAADFADDVVRILDELQLPHAIVGGHSLGGRNAWVVAARHPDRVGGALVVDYTPWVRTGVLNDLAVRVAGGNRAFGSFDEVADYLHVRYPLLPPEAVTRRAAGGFGEDGSGAVRPHADPAAMQLLIAGLRDPQLPAFLDVAVPMTHVRGSLSRIVDEQAWTSARAARPADRWVLVQDADHYVPEERPDVVVEELERLLGGAKS